MILVPIKNILPNPWQPRQSEDADHIGNLAENIRTNRYLDEAKRGLLQIPVARLVNDRGEPLPGPEAVNILNALQNTDPTPPPILLNFTYYQLAFGHSRLAAFKLLHAHHPKEGWSEMPLEIVFYGNLQMATSAWTENAQRKDLNPMEEAVAIQRMMTDFRWTQDKAAETLNINRSTVANKVRLLKLPPAAQAKLQSGELSERQAMALLAVEKLPEPIKSQIDYDDLTKRATAMSSDEIRQATERITTQMSHRLTTYQNDQLFPFDQPIEAIGVISPTCVGCANFFREGKDPRCTNKTCIAIKAERWNVMQLQPAASALGLPMAPKERGWHDYQTITKDTYDHARAKTCPKLEVGIEDNRAHFHPDRKAFPHTVALCHSGGGQCGCAMALARQASKEKTGGMTLGKAKEQYERETLDPAVRTLASALNANDEGAWKALFKVVCQGRSMTGWGLAEYQGAIAEQVLTHYLHEPWRDLDKAKTEMESRLKDAGLEAPWNATALQKLESGWKVLEAWYRESASKLRKLQEMQEAQKHYSILRDHALTASKEDAITGGVLKEWSDQIYLRQEALHALDTLLRSAEWGDNINNAYRLSHSPIITLSVDSPSFARNLSDFPTPFLKYWQILLKPITEERQRYDAIRIEIKRRSKSKPAEATAAD